MIEVTLSQLSKVLSAPLTGDDRRVSSVSTDTRTMGAGALFVALVGGRFDGHDFVAQAIANGAVALLVEHAMDVSVPQIVVANTTAALGQIAAWVHQQCQIPTIAITGSCGKTTVKEMVA
ncbi:Mur ligase domain-containing protein, partial [Vibrio sp. PP-XX7]